MKRHGALLLTALLLGLGGALPAVAAPVIDATLDVRFGSGKTGDFADVRIEETGDGGLQFSIRLREDLGSRADLGQFYFNLPCGVGGLEIETLGHVSSPFHIQQGRSTRGGAGARFDVAVSFGNGRGKKGNGTLREAEFVVRADQPLTIADILERTSQTSQGIEVHIAAFTQGSKGGGPTVGTFVPEPGTGLLLGGGLLAVALARSTRRSQSR